MNELEPINPLATRSFWYAVATFAQLYFVSQGSSLIEMFGVETTSELVDLFWALIAPTVTMLMVMWERRNPKRSYSLKGPMT